MPVLRSVRSAIARAVRRAIDIITDSVYSVAGEEPQAIADYAKEFYRGINVAKFSDTLSHSRASNATMVDGYGPELVTTSTFNSSDISAWSVASGTNSVVDNKLRVTNTINGNYGYAYQAITVEVGKQYELDVIADVHTVSNAHIRVGTTQGGDEYINENILKTTEAKRARERFTATTTTAYVRVGVGVNSIDSFVDIVSVSLRELPSIKWAPHNLFAYSEDFSHVTWTKADTVITPNVAVAPDGTTTADEVEHTADGAVFSETVSTGIIDDINYTVGAFVKRVDAQWFRIFGDGGNAYFDLTNGTKGSISGNTISSYMADVGNGWYYVSMLTPADGSSFSTSFLIPTGDLNTAEATGVSVYMWGAHLYRSDLGGMVDNPDQPASRAKYVPTVAREVTGIELLTNGGFDSEDLSDWTTMSATAAVVNGQVVITDDPSDSTGGRIYQAFTTEVGKTYQVSYNKISGPSGASVYASLNSSYGTNLGGGITQTGNQSFTFVATATSTTIVVPTGTTSGLSATFDSISVKEVIGTPSAQRFMPRRNHHVFNGAEWVNEGYYHESSSRTNRIQWSEDLTHSMWENSGGALTITADDKALGMAMWELDDSSTTNYGQLAQNLTNSVSATQVFALSCFVKKDTTATSNFGLRLYSSGSAGIKYTGIAIHTGNGTIDGAWTDELITRTVEDWGDFWRICAVGQISAGNSGDVVQIFPAHNSLSGGGSSANVGSHIVGGVQLEVSDHASMYKPTRSGFVSSSGDVMQIFASNLPWPSPEYAGDEILTNGDFSQGTTGWSAQSDATLAVVDGRLRVTTNDPDNYSLAAQDFPVVAGKHYRVTVTKVSQDVPSAWGIAPNQGNGLRSVIDFGYSSTGAQEGYFTAETTGMYRFQLWSDTNSGNPTATTVYDNVSVREVASLPGVTVTMKGRFTYADRGGLEAQPWRWSQGNDELLSLYLYTTGSETGEINVFHEARGNSINTNTHPQHYSPGVLVPFNIATTATHEECSIAAEGKDYGAATTNITRLPDLEYANLQIGYDFSGTISSLRVWDTDLGVQGRMDATAPDLTPSLQLNFDGSNTSYSDDGWVQ